MAGCGDDQTVAATRCTRRRVAIAQPPMAAPPPTSSPTRPSSRVASTSTLAPGVGHVRPHDRLRGHHIGRRSRHEVALHGTRLRHRGLGALGLGRLQVAQQAVVVVLDPGGRAAATATAAVAAASVSDSASTASNPTRSRP